MKFDHIHRLAEWFYYQHKNLQDRELSNSRYPLSAPPPHGPAYDFTPSATLTMEERIDQYLMTIFAT